MNTIKGIAVTLFFPLDLIVGSLMLALAPRCRATEAYVYGEWRDNP